MTCTSKGRGAVAKTSLRSRPTVGFSGQMLGIVRRLAVASGLAGACLLTQAQVDAAPVGSWVDNLSAATQPGPTDDWGPQHAAEADVARKISELVATRPGAPELTARNLQGRTPLLRAALWGYASVVDALLADASVRAAIDTADFGGLTAWMAGQYAQPLTLASCHPQVLITEAVGLWGPNLRRIAYFSTQSPTPFDRIRTALARAGAKPDIEAAKRIWLNACPGHAPRAGASHGSVRRHHGHAAGRHQSTTADVLRRAERHAAQFQEAAATAGSGD